MRAVCEPYLRRPNTIQKTGWQRSKRGKVAEMALYHGSPVSGRMGDVVFARDGRIWQYRRKTDPKTEAQQRHRALFAEASRLWRELSEEERHLWELYRRYRISEGLLEQRRRGSVTPWHFFMSEAVRALREGRPVPRTPENTAGIRSQP